MPHKCHATGCTVQVPPRMLMCKRHWKMVPFPVQTEVWKYYQPGQEVTKDPSEAYLNAMRAAIEAVEVAEGRRRESVESVGRVNAYRCLTCQRDTVTINKHEGVTPFTIRCQKEGCDGEARSRMYRVSQNLLPSHEWYRPADEELAQLDEETREHVDCGGLLLRPVPAVDLGGYGYKLRHG